MNFFKKLFFFNKQSQKEISKTENSTSSVLSDIIIPEYLTCSILLETNSYDWALLEQVLKNDWDFNWTIASTNPKKTDTTWLASADDMAVYWTVCPNPIPNQEAEKYVRYNLLWENGIEDMTKAHLLLTKVASSMLKQDNTIGIYFSFNVLQKQHFLRFTEIFQNTPHYLPTSLWIHIGCSYDGKTANFLTIGMNKFGKREFEIIKTTQDINKVYAFLQDIINHTISHNVDFQDGEIVQLTPNERYLLSLSKGNSSNNTTIKISQI